MHVERSSLEIIFFFHTNRAKKFYDQTFPHCCVGTLDMCASLNHRKKIKAEPSRLFPRSFYRKPRAFNHC